MIKQINMNQILKTIGHSALLLLVFSGIGVKTVEAAQVEASNARIVLPEGDTITTPGYLVLENKSDEEIILIKIRSNAFALSMIHQSVNDRGHFRMILKSELILKPKSKIVMKHDDVHFMFAGPKRKLKKGKTVKVNLYLNTGERIPVEFKLVR